MDVTDDSGINTLDYTEGKGQEEGDASQTFNMIYATAEGKKVCTNDVEMKSCTKLRLHM